MPSILLDKWSYKHDKCLKCGTTDNKHDARGYCKKCYGKEFRELSNERLRRYRKIKPQVRNTFYKYKKATRIKSDYCEICNNKCNTVFDHDHKTGKFRGWICHQCNISLGMVKDKIDILHKMIEYLVKNS